eukprot:TRINITY_DN1923_c0_g1_i5.p1 TRINITY_DN1923_c0_g1~~TRINITY_DN1923_c0_g1_i5.p1  ORF type:complete len:504 (-),score=0.83 TRINITY_DN1923_c0_g1_i5:325-1836(-)
MGKTRLEQHLEKNFLNIVEYSKSDVKSLKELFLRVREEFYGLLGVYIEDYKTISSMSYKCFKASLESTVVLPIADEQVDALVRKSIYGGRAQMFRPMQECEDTASLDFVSLYPFVMMNRDYPLGVENPVYTRTYERGLLGVYEVLIEKQPNLKIIPFRGKEEALDWTYEGQISCWITSVDYECLMRHSSKVEVRHGFVWKHKTSTLFKGFMGRIMEKKKAQDLYKRQKDQRYNKSYRECLKLVLNSLSGKMIERVWNKRKILVKTQLDIKRAEKRMIIDSYTPLQESSEYLIAEGKIRNPKIKTPSIIGSLIYSYAREWVYERALVRSNTKYGTDTDSLFLGYSEMLELREKNKDVFGFEEGQMTNEFDLPFASIFISPKCYIYYRKLNEDYREGYEFHKDGTHEILKPRWKGIRKEDKIIDDEHLVELIRNGRVNMEMLHDIYHNGGLKHALSIGAYKAMIKQAKERCLYTVEQSRKMHGQWKRNDMPDQQVHSKEVHPRSR